MFTENQSVHHVGMFLMLALAMSWQSRVALASDADCIRPYEKNPYYWQYKGEPVLLLGQQRYASVGISGSTS